MIKILTDIEIFKNLFLNQKKKIQNEKKKKIKNETIQIKKINKSKNIAKAILIQLDLKRSIDRLDRFVLIRNKKNKSIN